MYGTAIMGCGVRFLQKHALLEPKPPTEPVGIQSPTNVDVALHSSLALVLSKNSFAFLVFSTLASILTRHGEVWKPSYGPSLHEAAKGTRQALAPTAARENSTMRFRSASAHQKTQVPRATSGARGHEKSRHKTDSDVFQVIA